MNPPRVRIAPSPTGDLHIGTARTALFNFLFARKNNGKFILRIEDTDLERSEERFTKNIYDSLKALGLTWDEGPDIGGEFGPYVQSERLELYKLKALELVDKGHAYYCYCTPEELEAEKEIAAKEKKPLVYSQRCRNLSEDKIRNYVAEGRKPVIRFKVPEKDVVVDDIIRGKVNFDRSLIGDFVILKSNGIPTYNFAVVVDDLSMKITHVIRGEDHISNTPRQIILYNAFGEALPQFAHVGMILATDRTKLSKRHGATAVSQFVEKGYLPEAMVNYLALLGWSLPDGEEIKNVSELISLFSLEKLSHSAAIFDIEKLNWMNGIYIRNLDLTDYVQRCKKYLTDYNLSQYSPEKLELMLSAVRKNLVLLSDVTEAVSYFFSKDVKIEDNVFQNALNGDYVSEVLEKFLSLTDELDFNNLEDIEQKVKQFTKSLKHLKMKQIMMAIRASLTGQVHGADLNICIFLLGKEIIQYKIQNALKLVGVCQ